MRGRFNDAVRWLEGKGSSLLNVVLAGIQFGRLALFSVQQGRLRKRYQIKPETPILSYGEQLRGLIGDFSRKTSCHQYAFTSGSTSVPKRIPYPTSRLYLSKFVFWTFFLQACRAHGIGRRVLYVFSSFQEDQSVTSLLLEERNRPSLIAILPAPYRVERFEALRELARQYGSHAVRLWILTLSNPGVLYATNPSTISVFLDELSRNWSQHSRLVRDYYNFTCSGGKCESRDAAPFDSGLAEIARLLTSKGAQARLKKIAKSSRPLQLEEWAPGVEAVICWTGGYLRPFLRRLRQFLPPERYQLIPMYSMSTETIETIAHFARKRAAPVFLPLAPGVYYEFLDSEASPCPESLISATELKRGQTYTLIATDSYGLRRYNTQDLFLCRGFYRGLPDLEFSGRRSLEYSFTGEKLSANQVSAAIDEVRRILGSAGFITCVPSWPKGEAIPHYKLVVVREDQLYQPELRVRAERCLEKRLQRLNREYRAKRESGRLGPVRYCPVTLQEFTRRLRGKKRAASWESQFKFLPLYSTLWEENPRPFEQEVRSPHPIGRATTEGLRNVSE